MIAMREKQHQPKKGGQKMAKVLATKEFTGSDMIPRLKETLRNIRAQGLRVPHIAFRGKGTFQGFDVEVLEDKPVHVPIGHRLLKVVTEEGRAAKSLKPAEDAVVTVYTVAEGEPIKDSDPMSVYDLFVEEIIDQLGEVAKTEPEDED